MSPTPDTSHLAVIKKLMDAPLSEVPSVVAANEHLIDASFVKSMESVIAQLHERGAARCLEAVSLRSLAEQFRIVLNLPPPDYSADYARFYEALLGSAENKTPDVLSRYSYLTETADFSSVIRRESEALVARG